MKISIFRPAKRQKVKNRYLASSAGVDDGECAWREADERGSHEGPFERENTCEHFDADEEVNTEVQ